MPLVPVDVRSVHAALPEEVEALIADANERIARFMHDRRDDPIAAFIPSDFPLVYRTLETIRDDRLAPGDRFCEWGSGFGVVAALAAQLGYESHAIEIEGDLVDEAMALSEEHELDVEHLHGSFIPRTAQRVVEDDDALTALTPGGPDALEAIGLAMDDFDVVFAFPWPGEQHVFERLFDAVAADGALLVTFHGVDGMIVQRRTS